MTKLEKIIWSKIIFYKNPKRNCFKYFDKLEEIPSSDRFKSGKRLKITKSKKEVVYDSFSEKKVLKDLDNCKFVKEIKTQSLIINYIPMLKVRKYYPDIQIILNDGVVVIIEVKPFREMVNKKNILKHEALEKYCKKHRFGLAIIDSDYYSFEDLKNEKVPIIVQNKFIKFVKEKKELTFDECDNFKKKYHLTDYQLCYIIWNSRKKHLVYNQHLIKYI